LLVCGKFLKTYIKKQPSKIGLNIDFLVIELLAAPSLPLSRTRAAFEQLFMHCLNDLLLF